MSKIENSRVMKPRTMLKKIGIVKLAQACGVTHQCVSQWRRVPAHHVLKVEAATGISRHLLRPDIFGPTPEGAPSPSRKRAAQPMGLSRAQAAKAAAAIGARLKAAKGGAR